MYTEHAVIAVRKEKSTGGRFASDCRAIGDGIVRIGV